MSTIRAYPGPKPRLLPNHDAVVARLAAGEKHVAIAAEFGVGVNAVSRYGRRVGLKRPPGRVRRSTTP